MNSQTNTALPLQFNLDNHLINFLTNLNKNNLPKIILGKIASSSNLPNPPWQVALLQKARVDVVEMEAAGIMQACWMFNSSCIVIRGVSNNPKQPFTLKDIQLAADNAAKVVVAIIANFNN